MNKYLNLRRMEFSVTYQCTSKCRHCYSTPKAEAFPGRIDEKLAREIVRKVGENYRLKSVMTFGGEPLLYPEVVCAVHEEATRAGIPIREVITNGYWSNDIERNREIAVSMREAGVNRVDISVDAFHQEHVPLSLVRKAAEECLRAGIDEVSWNPCWVVSEIEDNPWNRRTRAILEELKDIPVATYGKNTLEPDGLALVYLKEYLPKREKMPKGKCGEIPYTNALDSVEVIGIEPDGSVGVCDDLYIGNASRTGIIEILEGYDPFEITETKAILEGGMEGLVSLAKSKGVEPDPEGYYSICHMCKSLRRGMAVRSELR